MKAEARYGCLRDVFATNVGYSSLNVDWRQRFKVGEKERVLMQGHRVSGDDVETVRVYYEGGCGRAPKRCSTCTFRCWNRNRGW